MPLRRSLLALALGLVFAVGLLEGTLRGIGLFHGEMYRANILPLWEATTDLRPFALRANFQYRLRTPDFDMQIRTNDGGLREDRSMAELLAGERRILVMGDSQTFGYGVNVGERYSDLLQAGAPPGTTVFTTGYANGFSPVDYAGYLRTTFDTFRPELVIVGLFPENDLIADVRARTVIRDAAGDIIGTALNGARVVDGYLTGSTAPASWAGRTLVRCKNWVWGHSAVYRLAEQARTAVRARRQPDQGNTQIPGLFFGERASEPEIGVTLDALVQMHRFLAAKGSALLVVIIPSNFQIAARYESSVTSRPGYQATPAQMASARWFGADHTRPVLFSLQEDITRRLKAQGVRVVDPAAQFVWAEQAGTRLYFAYDGHLTREGHRVLAEVISTRLGTED